MVCSDRIVIEAECDIQPDCDRVHPFIQLQYSPFCKQACKLNIPRRNHKNTEKATKRSETNCCTACIQVFRQSVGRGSHGELSTDFFFYRTLKYETFYFLTTPGKRKYGKGKYETAHFARMENACTEIASTNLQGWKTQVRKMQVQCKPSVR